MICDRSAKVRTGAEGVGARGRELRALVPVGALRKREPAREPARELRALVPLVALRKHELERRAVVPVGGS